MAARRLLPLVLIMLCATMSAGCLEDLDDPSKSFSAIPQLLLDHQPDTGETRVWLMSVLSHVRYENMSLSIDDGGPTIHMWEDELAYSLDGGTNATAFTLTAAASTEDRDFYLVCSVQIVEEEEELLFIITVEPPEDEPGAEPDETELASEDLPWKKTLTERPRAPE